ncbi:MAG: hypothetical protein R3E42_06640 [Burkholderiaceae bacterium]
MTRGAQDGLVTSASTANKFVNDAREIVKTDDIVKVKVIWRWMWHASASACPCAWTHPRRAAMRVRRATSRFEPGWSGAVVVAQERGA